ETVALEILLLGNVSATGAAPEVSLEEEVVAMGPRLSKRRRKRGNDGANANAPPKMLRKDHATSRPTQSILGGKSLASMGVEPVSTSSAPPPQETPANVSDPDPLSYVKPRSSKEVIVVGDPDSEKSSSSTSLAGWPGIPPGYFLEFRHLPNDEFLSQYNINLVRQVAMGSQLRLRSVDLEVQGLRNQTSNLKTLLEAEADMKKAAEAKNAELSKELESLRTQFLDLQVDNNQLSQQVSNLQAKVTGEEKMKAAFEEFKKYGAVPSYANSDRGSPMGDRAQFALSGLAKGMSEGLKYGLEHGKAGRDLADVEAYDPEANNKLVKALQDLKELKYPMIDQLEKLKDAPIELIMTSLHLESDTGENAPQWIRDLRPSSSQLKIPIYPEVRAPEDPWAIKEEVPLKDAIAENKSRAEKKKKCRVVCRTHGIGSAHHAGLTVSLYQFLPSFLRVLPFCSRMLVRRLRDLPPMYNLVWP
ncbi:hypothetical protein Tco_1367797, partial [Tanacetum coccineum]